MLKHAEAVTKYVRWHRSRQFSLVARGDEMVLIQRQLRGGSVDAWRSGEVLKHGGGGEI